MISSYRVAQIIRQWVNECNETVSLSCVQASFDITHEQEKPVVTIYSNLPGIMIGKAGWMVEKYTALLQEHDASCMVRMREVSFIEPRNRCTKENKAEFLASFCQLLQKTTAAGHPKGNPLVEIRYINDEHGNEIARPIFEDGSGKNGYYDVNISGDSNIGILCDMVDHFVREVW